MAFRRWAISSLFVLLSGCTPSAFIVTDARTSKEAKRWPNSVELRTAEAEYWVTFTYSARERSHAALVSTRAAGEQIDARQPQWLELNIDGQRLALGHWVTRAQSSVTGQAELLCYGEQPVLNCGRDPKQGDRWTWKYVLSTGLVESLSRAKHVRVTLGLVPHAVYQELEADDATWLAAFFQQTTTPKR